jgi:hypothetical protein
LRRRRSAGLRTGTPSRALCSSPAWTLASAAGEEAVVVAAATVVMVALLLLLRQRRAAAAALHAVGVGSCREPNVVCARPLAKRKITEACVRCARAR